MPDLQTLPAGYPELLQKLKEQVRTAQARAAVAVNATLTLLYWSIGDRIRRSVLGAERAAYGERILATLSQDLLAEFGRGFELTNLTRMVKFRGGLPGRGDCCDAVATIELVALSGAASACQAAAAGVLR